MLRPEHYGGIHGGLAPTTGHRIRPVLRCGKQKCPSPARGGGEVGATRATFKKGPADGARRVQPPHGSRPRRDGGSILNMYTFMYILCHAIRMGRKQARDQRREAPLGPVGRRIAVRWPLRADVSIAA